MSRRVYVARYRSKPVANIYSLYLARLAVPSVRFNKDAVPGELNSLQSAIPKS